MKIVYSFTEEELQQALVNYLEQEMNLPLDKPVVMFRVNNGASTDKDRALFYKNLDYVTSGITLVVKDEIQS